MFPVSFTQQDSCLLEVIYPHMCRKTESQVWSAAETSMGYSEMQHGCDHKMKFQCLVIFMRCKEFMPYKKSILPHSKTTCVSSNSIITWLKHSKPAQYFLPQHIEYFHCPTAFGAHCTHRHVWKTRTLTASRRQHRWSFCTCQDLRGNMHMHRFYETPQTPR